MSDTLITALVGGIVAIILLWMQNAQSTKMAKIALSQTALEKSQSDLHKQINSRMDELLEITRKNARAEGKAEGEAGNSPK